MRFHRRAANATTTEHAIVEEAQVREAMRARGWCEVMVLATRKRAYHLWEAAGHPAGDGFEFWLKAERELASKGGRGYQDGRR